MHAPRHASLAPYSARRAPVNQEETTKIASLHPWGVEPREAVAIQSRLRGRLRFPDRPLRVRRVAGADLSFSIGSDRLFAGIAVLSWPDLELLEERTREDRASFPYVPGLLSFREIPALLPLFESLREPPDLVVCDGQGTAHPRGFGLASHLGLLLGTPTIGCAKSLLVGVHREPRAARGARARLLVDGVTRGAALRTRAGARPIIVSPGHLVSLDESVRWALRLAPRFRVPEPVRAAHSLVNRARRDIIDAS